MIQFEDKGPGRRGRGGERITEGWQLVECATYTRAHHVLYLPFVVLHPRVQERYKSSLFDFAQALVIVSYRVSESEPDHNEWEK